MERKDPLNTNIIGGFVEMDIETLRDIPLSDPTEIPPYRETPVARPVALCFLWYRRLSLLHPHFFP